MSTLKTWFNTILNKKHSLMGLLGVMFTISSIVISFYLITQVSFFLGKNKISVQVFERIVTLIFMQLFQIVMLITVFYFKNNTKQEENL